MIPDEHRTGTRNSLNALDEVSVKEKLMEYGYSYIRLGLYVLAPSAIGGSTLFFFNMPYQFTFVPLLLGVFLIGFGIYCSCPFIKLGYTKQVFKNANDVILSIEESIVPGREILEGEELKSCMNGIEKLEKGKASGNMKYILSSIAEFDQAIGKNPQSKYAYYHKARAIIELNKELKSAENSDQAKRCIDKALSIDPNFREAQELKKLLDES